MTTTMREARGALALPEVTEKPDGFYWRTLDFAREYGPFETLAQAQRDLEESTAEPTDEAIEPAATLEEAEDEIGVSGWVDPDTGELAEDSIARLEEH